MDDIEYEEIDFPITVSQLSEFTDIPRSSVLKAIREAGFALPPVDPDNPETYKRITREIADTVVPTLKRNRRSNEIDLKQLGRELMISDTSMRRYIRLGVISDYTLVRYPRQMYVFTPRQAVFTKRRIKKFEQLKKQGYRSFALAKAISEYDPTNDEEIDDE